jgi:hypothetical protein
LAPSAQQAHESDRRSRYSLKDAVDEAVPALLAAFRDGSPADPAATVWRCFPKLNREHCGRLAERLVDIAD